MIIGIILLESQPYLRQREQTFGRMLHSVPDNFCAKIRIISKTLS